MKNHNARSLEKSPEIMGYVKSRKNIKYKVLRHLCLAILFNQVTQSRIVLMLDNKTRYVTAMK